MVCALAEIRKQNESLRTINCKRILPAAFRKSILKEKQIISIFTSYKKIGSHRLGVRSSLFHSENTGSNPVGSATSVFNNQLPNFNLPYGISAPVNPIYTSELSQHAEEIKILVCPVNRMSLQKNSRYFLPPGLNISAFKLQYE